MATPDLKNGINLIISCGSYERSAGCRGKRIIKWGGTQVLGNAAVAFQNVPRTTEYQESHTASYSVFATECSGNTFTDHTDIGLAVLMSYFKDVVFNSRTYY